MPSVRTRSRISLRRRGDSAQPSPRPRPRRVASAMFSAIDISGAVPANGFWKTRPTSLARLCSGHAVTSSPAIRMEPSSTSKLPATALRSVDFPEPLVPITMRNEPSSIDRLTPRSARTSFGVSAWNVLRMAPTSSMRPPPAHSREEIGKHERRKHKQRRQQFEVVRIQARTQRNRDEKTEQDRSHRCAHNQEPEACAADERLAEDYARKPPYHHADSHLHVGKPLVLREQCAGEGSKPIGHREAENHHVADVDAERADHLAVVARRAHRGAEIGAQERVKNAARGCDDERREHEHRGVARCDFPAEDDKAALTAEKPNAEMLGFGRERFGREQRNVALSHDVQIDRVERRHHENSRQQAIDAEARVKNSRSRSCEHAGAESGKACEERIGA